jgi:hypothetical protein
VICFVVAAFHSFSRGDEENKRKPYSKQPVLGPTIEVIAYGT